MRYFIWIFLIALVAFRYFSTRVTYNDGQQLRISGQIIQEPTIYPTAQRIFLSGIKIYLQRFPEVHYGDNVVIEGTYQDGELKKPKLLSQRETNNTLINFKRKLVSFWQSVLPEPHASLIAGITLGYKSSLPESFVSDLRKTGTTHVVVASGMNVTFVATFMLTILLLVFSRRRALVISFLGIVSYCIVTGLEAPVVRAAIMVSFTFLGQVTGRVTQAMRLTVLSALVMLIYKPLWLVDIGFILSFVATLSLLLFESKVNRKLSLVPEIFRESLSTSLAAQIGVAPIIFLTFGQFNILSPIINALVLWVVPLIMIIGSVGGVIGLVVPIAGKMIIYLSYPLTSWFIWIVQNSAKI